MRILILGLNFAPEPIGVGKYSGEMAAWLAAHGHDIEVITTHPYYPEPREPAGSGWTRDVWMGCRVIRCPLYVPKRWGGVRRALHLASFAASSLPAAAAAIVRARPDVIAAIVPTLMAAPIALVLARLTGAKSWLHVQDFEVDAGIALGQLGDGRAAAAARAFERQMLTRFDVVSAISEPMVRALADKGVAAPRTMLAPNWTDTTAFRPLPETEVAAARRAFGIAPGQIVALYAGNMGAKQGLDHVIAAAARLAGDGGTGTGSGHAPPLFVLAGAGSARTALERQAQGVANVRLLPLQPADTFNAFLNIADMHLLPQLSEVNDLVMPSKLGAMLATGRPVIATVAAASLIGGVLADGGIAVPPGRADVLAEAVAALAANADRRAAMGRAARAIAVGLPTPDAILSGLSARLERLVSGPA